MILKVILACSGFLVENEIVGHELLQVILQICAAGGMKG
jgi:hypothetical protein